jgi:hypothetical protein
LLTYKEDYKQDLLHYNHKKQKIYQDTIHPVKLQLILLIQLKLALIASDNNFQTLMQKFKELKKTEITK